MIKRLKTFTLQLIAGANVATIVLMLLVGFSDYLQPQQYPMLSSLGLGFPVFPIINFGFLVFWLVFHWRGALIPIAGFLIGYVPIRQYCPLNLPISHPNDAIKVLSYNVWGFAGWEDKEGEINPIITYIAEQDADLVCLQESYTNELRGNEIDSVLVPLYPHRDTARVGGGEVVTLFSKHPILSKEHIEYESKGNLSAAFRVMINGEETLVINNHLETTGLSAEDKTEFGQMISGRMEREASQQASMNLLAKLGKATAIRAAEADAVARFIDNHRRLPIIVCGDFNDGPISYVRRTVAKGLTDCYVSTANGPGISYHHGGFYVRIDHILCSDHFTPYECRVDQSIKTSDHYPILCWLKRN